MSILGEGEMPFNVFADEVFERTENVNSNLIICETLAVLVQVVINSQCIAAYMFEEKSKLVKCFHLHI